MVIDIRENSLDIHNSWNDQSIDIIYSEPCPHIQYWLTANVNEYSLVVDDNSNYNGDENYGDNANNKSCIVGCWLTRQNWILVFKNWAGDRDVTHVSWRD